MHLLAVEVFVLSVIVMADALPVGIRFEKFNENVVFDHNAPSSTAPYPPSSMDADIDGLVSETPIGSTASEGYASSETSIATTFGYDSGVDGTTGIGGADGTTGISGGAYDGYGGTGFADGAQNDSGNTGFASGANDKRADTGFRCSGEDDATVGINVGNGALSAETGYTGLETGGYTEDADSSSTTDVVTATPTFDVLATVFDSTVRGATSS